MSLQHRRGTPCFLMPQPYRVVKAATGHSASIRTPGDASYLLRMARKLLAQAASFSQLPQLDAAIPARARQAGAVGSKGQSAHPTAMSIEDLDAGGSPAGLDLPQPNGAGDVATGEQASIRAPGQRGDRARMRHVREGRAQLRLPQPQSRVMSPTGKHVSIRSKGQTVDAAGLPA